MDNQSERVNNTPPDVVSPTTAFGPTRSYEGPTAPSAHVVPARWYHTRPIRVLLDGQESAGQCAMVLSTEVAGDEPPRHVHSLEDETCYVLQGILRYCAGDTILAASAGTCVFLPRGLEHTFAVLSSPAQVLTVYTPAGFEGYVSEMSHAAAEAVMDGDKALELERMVAAAARYGCAITGPPPRRGRRTPRPPRGQAAVSTVLEERK